MIKFVYFDVGGVVIKDFSGTNKWDLLVEELGIAPINRNKFNEIWARYADKVCTTFDVDELIPVLVEELNLKIPHNYSFLMGFVDKFERNEKIWPIIQEIKKEVPVGLLTNQYPRMLEKLNTSGLMPILDWDAIVDSSVEKIQKPDSAIYELSEKKAKISGDNILFVDNSQDHLNAAKKFGWQTFLFDPQKSNESCEGLIEYFIINK